VDKAVDSSLKKGSSKILRNIAKQDRCPVWTLKPPWKHTQDITRGLKSLVKDIQNSPFENEIESQSISVKLDEEGMAVDPHSHSKLYNLTSQESKKQVTSLMKYIQTRL
jgi:hypothetical protein